MIANASHCYAKKSFDLILTPAAVFATKLNVDATNFLTKLAVHVNVKLEKFVTTEQNGKMNCVSVYQRLLLSM